LPGIVDELAEDWGLTLGEPLAGGTAAYVVAAGDTVLKIELPEGDGWSTRVAVLRAADGRGYARLLRHDDDRRALLLERLEPVHATFDELRGALEVAWQVPGDAIALPTAREKAASLAERVDRLWNALGRPCPRTRVDDTLACCASRAAAFDEGRAVVVHGDAQSPNCLRRRSGGFAFVDPEPFLCEPAYDIAVALRHAPLAPGFDDAVREWHTIERLSTAFECLRIGATELGRQLLDDP
jgi:streptomycin 6-kinase